MMICAKKSGTETIKTGGTLDEQYKRLVIKNRGVFSAKRIVEVHVGFVYEL